MAMRQRWSILLAKKLGLTDDIAVLLTGREAWAIADRPGAELVRISTLAPSAPPQDVPAHLSAEIRLGMTTRRHEETESRLEPLWVHGELQRHREAETKLRDLLRRAMGRRWWKFIGPRVVVAAPAQSEVRKRVLLDLMKKAGAQHAYLVEPEFAAAIGLFGEAVAEEDVRGILNLRADDASFAAVSFAEILVRADRPIGVEQLLADPIADDPAPRPDFVNALADAILIAMGDLREPQLTRLAAEPISVVGPGAAYPALLDELNQRLGLTLTPRATDPSIALAGLQYFLARLDEWKAVLEFDADS